MWQPECMWDYKVFVVLTWICDNRELVEHVTLWKNTKCNVVILNSSMGHEYSPKVVHIHKACGTMRQSKKLRKPLYRTIMVQDPNMKQIGKIMKRALGRMIQLLIYYTLVRYSARWATIWSWLGLNEDLAALDVGGRHLGNPGSTRALWRWWTRIRTLWVLDNNSCAVDYWCVCVHISEPFWEIIYNL